MLEKAINLLNLLPIILFYCLALFIFYLYLKDKYQTQHSVLRTHPIIGRIRYILEMVGEELRQYLFLNNKENKPIDRDTQETIAKSGKYASTVIGFGSKKDFSKPDFYLANSMFPKNNEELKVDNKDQIQTFMYKILNESLTDRKEKRFPTSIKPWYLEKEQNVTIGANCKFPFTVKGLIGVSAMSYGALSKSAVKALSQGVAISGGSWMDTGEGGISPYHLSKIYEINKSIKEEMLYEMESFSKKTVSLYNFIDKHIVVSNFEIYEHFKNECSDELEFLKSKSYINSKETDLIFQVGSGLFGAKKDGEYSEEVFKQNALKHEVKAIEIKLAQGAKVRGGKLPKEKITEEIAEIRGVKMGEDVNSPNRFPLFNDMKGLFSLIMRWKEITGKPVGIKVVAGSEDSFIELAQMMKESNSGPDFITIDGGEGGTGATYQEMADSLGLPIYSGLMILDDTLKKYGVRNRVKIIASGMLATADKMAIALSFGADLIHVARAAMNTIGCINAHKCHTNLCPTGVTSHLPNLEAGLVVEEKRFRTANYLTTMRQGLFMLGASCGIDSPTKFERIHVTYRDSNSKTFNYGKTL